MDAGCLIIGEVAQAHDGSLALAHAYIDAIADAGAGAVKFQTHIASAESTAAEPWRVPFSRQDASRYDYWKRMEFTEEGWAGLRAHADERGIAFYSSPFSPEAAELLARVGVAGWKIASGEVGNLPLLDLIASRGEPVLLSSGMSGWEELDAAVGVVRAHGCDLTVMQCSSIYPTPAGSVGLDLIPQIRDRYGCRAGLSDHSGTIFPGLAAVAHSISTLEVHVTLTRSLPGPDVPVSITHDELRTLVEGVRFLEAERDAKVDKDEIATTTAPLRDIFTKSLVARTDLSAGTVLERHHLAGKKPGTGIPPSRIDEVLGKQLKRPVPADVQISPDDFG